LPVLRALTPLAGAPYGLGVDGGHGDGAAQDVLVRPEQAGDHDAVRAVHLAAFGDHGRVVAALVDDLRAGLDAGPGLSLVATVGSGAVVGHALFSRALLDAPQRLVDVQVLSPLAVHPDHQRRGTGGALVGAGLRLLADRGVPVVFLEGDPGYYARLGFGAATAQGFRTPSLRIPEPAFQALALPGHEPWMTGTLVYPDVFWRHDCVGLRDPRGADR
jgi:putative acetyltransferase